MNERYQGVREEPSSCVIRYRARTADKLVLTDSNGEKSHYRAKGANALEMLDREGNPVASQLNYTLVPVTASLPVTPMPLRYVCITGRCGDLYRRLCDLENGSRSPVTPSLSAAIWRRKVKRKTGAADGRRAWCWGREPGHGRAGKTLIADKNVKFAPGKIALH